MQGDVVIPEKHHERAGEIIAKRILPEIRQCERRYIITISGESGSGKSETASAIRNELWKESIPSIILGQDDYFYLPPKSNDQKRRSDPAWLGPCAEVRMELLNENIRDAINDAHSITKPLVDYTNNSISEETVILRGVKAVIVEGTYVALLRYVNCRVFIGRNRLDTLEHRIKRNRGDEAQDPFVEGILDIEHKIIAGHRYLADILITKEYEVCFVQ